MIPNILHFVWIQGATSRYPGYGEYISVMSALKNTTYDIYYHTNLVTTGGAAYDPTKIVHPRFHLKQHFMPDVVQGVKCRLSLMSDIWRYKVLLEHGGIYSDLDIIWFKNLEPGYIPPGPIFLTAYENPSYKTIASAFLAAEPNFTPIQGLLEQFENILRGLAARGITDITVEPPSGLSRYHTLLWKPSGEFCKEHASLILGKEAFCKNGWRRIGRCLRRAGVPLRPVVEVEALGDTNDRLQFNGITGFHYYATLFSIEQLLELPDFKEQLAPIVDSAATFPVPVTATA